MKTSKSDVNCLSSNCYRINIKAKNNHFQDEKYEEKLNNQSKVVMEFFIY